MDFNKIYHEDCLDTLKRMEDDSVDVTITSPPYNLNLRIAKGKYVPRGMDKSNTIATKYGTIQDNEFEDNMPIDEYNEFHTKVLRELIRVSSLVFYNIQVVSGSKRSLWKMIGEFGDDLKDIIIWDKGNAEPAILDGVINRQSELILVFDKDYPIARQYRKKGRFARGTLNDIWQIKKERGKGGHGAIFPQELVKKILVNFSDEGDVIYDPFMGTGTTALVSKNLNRNYIGSERSEHYIKIAEERLFQPLEIFK